MLETTDTPLAPVRGAPAALPVPRFGGADAAHGSLMGVDDLPVSLPAARSTEAGVDEVPPSTPLRTWAVAAPLATLVLVAGAVGLVWWRTGPSTAPKTTPPPNAELRIETSSPGAWVLVNGLARGSTPLQLSLAPGKWRLEVEAATERRALDLELAPGSRATYVFDLRVEERAQY